MIGIELLCVSLVLGGAALLGLIRAGRIPRLRVARVPALVRRPVRQRNLGTSRFPDSQAFILPPPRVITRAGPRPGTVDLS
jgi:hypothetical protein